jgi:MinD superfamily P-loop ATPase
MDGGHRALIVDGPPGIGCSVISAVSGADLALIVAEPTLAGIHDMRRAIQTALHFRVPALVFLNKWDIYPAGAQEIERFCRQEQIDVVGRIPYDPAVIEAVVHGVPLTEYRPDAGKPGAQSISGNKWPLRSGGDDG